VWAHVGEQHRLLRRYNDLHWQDKKYGGGGGFFSNGEGNEETGRSADRVIG